MLAPANNNKRDASQIHIFIDLDGVLADFDAHARAHGKYTSDGRTKWDELDYQWWSTMPVYPGAKAFYDAALKLGEVRFLSAPAANEGCFSGKAHWVQGFLPEHGKFAMKELIICAARDKHYLAGANRILIDDRQNNIKDWVDAGGIGIHHNGDFMATLQKLQDVLKTIAAAPKPQQKPRRPSGPKP
jgi:hypothetical protein